MAPPRVALATRFWEKVSPSGECLVWTATRDKDGYGLVRPGGRGNNHVKAHRAAWFLHTGEWPPAGMLVCHTCDNPSCVRIEHLFLGTPKDNTQDMMRKGRWYGGVKGRTAHGTWCPGTTR